MRFLKPTVSAKHAWRVLHRVPLRRTRRLIRFCASLFHSSRNSNEASRPQQSTGRLPYLELVWLPHYVLTFEAILRGQSHALNMVVGGHEPTTRIIDLSAAEWESARDREWFPPSIPEDEAVPIARRAVLAWMLRSPGWGRKPELSEAKGVELVQCPYWAYYFARRGNMLDVNLLDATTGRPGGTKTKLSLLKALAAAKETA